MLPPILFYDPRNDYGYCSNFSRHSVTIYDRTWTWSEAPFQAAKFMPDRMDLVEKIAACKKPRDVANIGRDRSNPLRADWDQPPGEMFQRLQPVNGIPLSKYMVNDGRGMVVVIESVKDLVMYEIVLAKFSQHEDIRTGLLATGRAPLVEDSLTDSYWGWGELRTGKNKLGKILMVARDALS